MPEHEEQVQVGRFSEVIIMPIPWVGQPPKRAGGTRRRKNRRGSRRK